MGHRRKNRTHLKGAGAVKNAPEAQGNSSVPKSFVVKHGQVGSSLAQLVRDMRKVMEPNTASRLKERSRNKLKDYLSLAPSLNVTHLLAFTLTPLAPSLRIVRLPSGPTLSFRIERYSLIKDMLNASRHARGMGMEYLSPPLLVLASFPAPGPDTPPHLQLLIKSFQSLFPPLAPKTLSLSSCRRVVLVSWNAERGTVDFRHYLITVRAHGVSRRVRKVVEGATKSAATKMLNLGKEKDVADFLLRKRGEEDGYDTASTSAASEVDLEEATVKLAGNYVGRNNKKGERRAVRLDEIGPRMELRLVKITEGSPGKEGAVLFHEFIKKAPKEIAALKISAAQRQRLKKERREEQERNVARKKAEARPDDPDEGDLEDDVVPGESDEGEEFDEGAWDEDANVSDGDGDDISDESEASSEEDEVETPPRKQQKKSNQNLSQRKIRA